MYTGLPEMQSSNPAQLPQGVVLTNYTEVLQLRFSKEKEKEANERKKAKGFLLFAKTLMFPKIQDFKH